MGWQFLFADSAWCQKMAFSNWRADNIFARPRFQREDLLRLPRPEILLARAGWEESVGIRHRCGDYFLTRAGKRWGRVFHFAGRVCLLVGSGWHSAVALAGGRNYRFLSHNWAGWHYL